MYSVGLATLGPYFCVLKQLAELASFAQWLLIKVNSCKVKPF